MGIKRKIFDLATDTFINTFRLNKANILSCSFAEKLNPVYRVVQNGEEYVFNCPNDVTRWRVKTYFTKEPETINWIDTFKKGEVFFDIGANIGLYSIYAAKKGVNVVAFEPESQNYALLNKNVYLNKCDDTVICLNIALSDRNYLDYLYIPVFQEGGALNCFGETIDWEYKKFNPDYRQGVVSYSLDSFLSQHLTYFPTHIKIDVDGIEPKIIKGAEKTLKDSRLRSLSIEINEALSDHMGVVDMVKAKGFSLLHKKHAEMIEESKFSNCFNYLFIRK